jgi:uncharacterized protein (TIGR02118 family)
MIRRISFIRRKQGLSAEAFFSHWTGRHAEIVRQAPGLRGLRFSRIMRCLPGEAGWDGVGETWFDSIADCDRAFGAEPMRAMLNEDRKRFIGDSVTCYIEEATGFAPPNDASGQ